MTGKNEFKLCPAEMNKAIQYYFDKVIFKKGQSPKILKVIESKNYGEEFVITTEEKDGKGIV